MWHCNKILLCQCELIKVCNAFQIDYCHVVLLPVEWGGVLNWGQARAWISTLSHEKAKGQSKPKDWAERHQALVQMTPGQNLRWTTEEALKIWTWKYQYFAISRWGKGQCMPRQPRHWSLDKSNLVLALILVLATEKDQLPCQCWCCTQRQISQTIKALTLAEVHFLYWKLGVNRSIKYKIKANSDF